MSSRDKNSKTPKGRPTGDGSWRQRPREAAETALFWWVVFQRLRNTHKTPWETTSSRYVHLTPNFKSVAFCGAKKGRTQIYSCCFVCQLHLRKYASSQIVFVHLFSQIFETQTKPFAQPPSKKYSHTKKEKLRASTDLNLSIKKAPKIRKKKKQNISSQPKFCTLPKTNI